MISARQSLGRLIKICGRTVKQVSDEMDTDPRLIHSDFAINDSINQLVPLQFHSPLNNRHKDKIIADLLILVSLQFVLHLSRERERESEREIRVRFTRG